MLKSSCALIGLIALANPALAASCASPAETMALKTAVMQQELMVAAFQCHETGAYNRFVTSYRGELQDSDATLKGFFVRRGGEHGEAGYDTFKTKAANLSALEQARNSAGFCADAHALFADALDNHASLASFVNARAADIGNACTDSRPVVTAAAAPIAAPTRPVVVTRIADVQAAKPMVKVARADADVLGVPDHAAPAMPFRHEEPAPAAPAQDTGDAGPRASYATADEDDLPSPRARAVEIRDQQDDGYYGNAPYADRPARDERYGPPQTWYPPTNAPRRYRWAPPPPPPGYGW